MPTAPDKIPGNIEFAAKELLEARNDQRPAMLEGIAKALTRRLLQDHPRIGIREVSGRRSVRRVLMSRGITGQFETRKEAVQYACLRGDIASTAGLTIHEPDDGVVHFTSWRPLNQDALSGSAVPAPARKGNWAGHIGSTDQGLGKRREAHSRA